ncbi:hypothetical protein Ddye_029097 [Dipteronia dyeriana]|uniref:Uncharacterized protein n=1 Tax=Dipteronia dyeriana TaxID=168575 RepID=A0AAD9WLD2_9ROSI|nr:hypothetical protein Ddye_029097 [Dipteronia dyeriana]
MPPPSDEFDADEEEKPLKSDLFRMHMKKIELDDGTIKIMYNYCPKTYKAVKSFGYGTYWNHDKRNHPSELVKASNQCQISKYGTSTNQLFHYTSEKNKEELATMVAVEHLPFSFGEKVGFVNYCQTALNPAMQRVPRVTLTRAPFSIYKREKHKLKSFFFQYQGRVSVCADIWTDNFGRHHYMDVTCHYIDNNWNMQKRIIAFRVFDESHTAHNIFRHLKIIFEDFHIKNKIFTIGFDNAPCNTTSIPMLKELCNPYFGGKLFHQRCACHVLNLCVQAGLQILSVYIRPIRDSINYIWTHNKILKKWLKFCSQNNRRPIKFSRDISTHWNSTYKLLNESVEYKEILVSFITYNVPSISLQLKHWDVCIKILELLRVFNDATNALSGIYYPTTHLFLVQSVNIAGAFSDCELDVQLSQCVAAMKKINGYSIIRIFQIFICLHHVLIHALN